MRLRRGSVTLGQARFSVRPGRRMTVTVKLTLGGRQALARAGTLTATPSLAPVAKRSGVSVGVSTTPGATPLALCPLGGEVTRHGIFSAF